MAILITPKFYPDNTYTVFNPDHLGFTLGVITDKGKVLRGNDQLALVIDQIQRGIGNKKALAVRCAPIIPRVKKKDLTTLGKLFAPNKNRGNIAGLQAISENNRFKGRDWEADRRIIEVMDKKGYSVSKMARLLGVHHSTLSKANSRFSLYSKKPQVGRILR